MGVQIGEILSREKIEVENLAGRKIAIDAYNSLYQFLSIIRQPDGTPLMDSRGRITSHLSGLFYRTGKLIEAGVLPCYVFDGESPELKKGVLKARKKTRETAKEKWKEALELGDLEEAKKYAQAALKLSDEMVEDSKELLSAMGIPFVQAPSEGEAQAAFIAKKGDVWASASQDYDSLLFGTPNLVRNLTITGKRKLPRKNVFVMITPELINLAKTLEELRITQEQLIEIGIIVGTDYNAGIKGIGPKKALNFIRQGKKIKEIYEENKVEPEVELDFLKNLFLKPKVSGKYKLEWKKPEKEKILKILVEKHDFSLERIEKVVKNMEENIEAGTGQARLDVWFK